MEPRSILKKYLITEKSALNKEAEGKYTFEVDKRANKNQIKNAVEKAFGVEVISVHTVIMPGKVKRMGRNEGKTPTWKKAIVKLGSDQKITEFENM